MTREPNTARSPGGRILLAGIESRLVSECRRIRRPVRCVENLYDAIGEIMTAPASEPVELLVVDDSLLADVSAAALAALRQVDPAIRLMRVNGADRCDGHDGIFEAHLAPEHLAARIAELIGERVDAESIESPATPRTSVRLDSPRVGDEVEHHREPARPTSPEPPPRTPPVDEPVMIDPPRTPRREPEPPVEATREERVAHEAQDEADALGDTDLVDAVMIHPEGVRPVALELIRQQTGWRDLTLSPRHATLLNTEENVAHGVPVVAADHAYGTLQSQEAPPERLVEWARWLAKWLMLDERYRAYRTQSYQDDLTGAWNRRYFEIFLNSTIERAAQRRRPVSVMVLDLDDFKHYNDTYGHKAGDEILRETVRLLRSVIRQGDRVCRIGGDEFAVIFADLEGPRRPGSQHPENVEQVAQRFQDAICRMHFPKLGIEAPGTLSVSAGLATYPWDGQDAASLLQHADALALNSKRRGKNAITLGPGARRHCRPDARDSADHAEPFPQPPPDLPPIP